jgi:hypothetical protein
MNVPRAAHEADAGPHAGKNLARKQLPVSAGERQTEVANRHPGKREKQHALRAEPVNNMAARNLLCMPAWVAKMPVVRRPASAWLKPNSCISAGARGAWLV